MRVFLRPFWFVALLAHAAGAAAWWWLSPGGFPLDHPRFWIHRVLPLLVIVAAAGAMAAWQTHRFRAIRIILACLAGLWLAVAVSLRVVFPLSGEVVWLAPLGAAGLIAAAAAAVRWPGDPQAMAVASRRLPGAGWLWLAIGLLLGAAVPWALRAEDPSTQPLNLELGPPPEVSTVGRTTLVFLNSLVNVQTAEGVVAFRGRRYQAYVEPVLTFDTRSPDRCWTDLLPEPYHPSARHHFAGVLRQLDGLAMAFDDEGGSLLRVQLEPSGASAAIEAKSRLIKPVFSHLNNFCVLSLLGHRRASLVFSPCPGVAVEVLRADGHYGRPSRLAYVTEGGDFRIVEAASGNKGPFRTLASGKLGRFEPLEITFLDGAKPVFRARLEDWSAQASRSLSPTAGWGLPQNAIEFGLEEDYPQAAATVYMSLANTSVGLGWDSVGHAAGTYRNRMRAELLVP